jgi:hypothetical protein
VTGARWNAGTDVAVAIVLAVLTTFTVAYAAPRGFNEGFVDMGHDGYQLREALDLRNGGMVFRDTFEQYGPLGPYLNLVGFMAFGQRLLAIKYFLALWYGATAIVLYALSRRLLGRLLACFSILLWLALAPFYQHGVMISPHAYVIIFQAAAILLLLKRPVPSPAPIVAAGVLCGVCWLLKQSMGTLFLMGVISAVLMTSDFNRQALRATLARVALLVVGALTVVAAALLWLAARGAFHDWYLQTVQFPRSFYLTYFTGSSHANPISSLVLLLSTFVELQYSVEWYWIALRAIVVAGAVIAMMRRHGEWELVLAGTITAWLWLAAFPSVAFMHQWWTLSLGFGALVFIVRGAAEFATAHTGGARRWLVDVFTMVILAALVSPALFARVVDAKQRREDLSQTLTEPEVLRGLRTTRSMKEGFDRLNSVLTEFRARHPHTPIVSIDAGDGANRGIAESLPLLSWFDDTPHPFPVYWNLPVLSTSTYPEYSRKFAAFVRDRRPLIVDAVLHGWSHPVSGYVPLVVVPTERGRLIVYGPGESGGNEELVVGELRFPRPGVLSRVEHRSVVERPRLRPRPQFASINRDGRDVQARVYTSPEDAVPSLEMTSALDPLNFEQVEYIGKELKRDGRALVVDGQASGQYTYLLKLKQRFLRSGEYFFATGTVAEGGLSIGLLANDRWKGYLNVSDTGPFLAAVMAPADGQYSLVIANNIDRNFGDRIRSLGAKLAIVEWWRRSLPNRFRISASGWMSPDLDSSSTR